MCSLAPKTETPPGGQAVELAHKGWKTYLEARRWS